jgi:glutamate synthase (NADPH/NADH) large chain
MVTLYDDLEDADERMLRRLLENHAAYTGSEQANEILDNWDDYLGQFVKVMPEAYERVLEEEGRADVRDSPPEPAAPSADATRAVSDD